MRTLLVLLFAAALACNRNPRPTYRTEAVTRGPISEAVSATGEVSAVVTVSVGSQVSGTVSRLYVDWSSEVKKGSVLADLDPRLFQAALARAEAAFAAAEADVEKERSALAEVTRQEQRTLDLAKRQLASQAELQTAQAARVGEAAQLRGTDARVLQARADRDTARTNLELARIRSPIDGIVISRAVDVGQTVAAAFQAPTLFMIANDLSQMQVLAHVDEADVGKVHPDMTARFTVDAYPADTFSGRISEVRQAPTTIQNVVTYTAVIDAPNPQRKLRQGMTTQVNIVAAERPDALRLANAALRYRPQGSAPAPSTAVQAAAPAAQSAPTTARRERPVRPQGSERPARPEGSGKDSRVYRLEGGKPVAVRITTGLTDGRQTEVLSGLSEGDQVVVGDSSSSTPGASAPAGSRRGPF